jgi:uncharacterized protein (TIGR00251 family)
MRLRKTRQSKESAANLIIEVKTKPNAKQTRLEEQEDGTWIAHVQAPPVDGKANAKLTAMIAEHFGVSKRNVTILTGATSKRKRVEIELENQKESD